MKITSPFDIVRFGGKDFAAWLISNMQYERSAKRLFSKTMQSKTVLGSGVSDTLAYLQMIAQYHDNDIMAEVDKNMPMDKKILITKTMSFLKRMYIRRALNRNTIPILTNVNTVGNNTKEGTEFISVQLLKCIHSLQYRYIQSEMLRFMRNEKSPISKESRVHYINTINAVENIRVSTMSI